jgi:8-oxo-dGTP pyrophosphatase MutT (NUDIX family)
MTVAAQMAKIDCHAKPRKLLRLKQAPAANLVEGQKAALAASLPHIANLCDRWDSSGAGIISRKDISIAMLQFCTGVALHDIEEVLNLYDPVGSHTVRYTEFAQWLSKSKAFAPPSVPFYTAFSTAAANERRARLVLLFERLPKLLGRPEKVAKKKLRKEFPNLPLVVEAVVSGYLAHGVSYYCNLENHLEQLLPGVHSEDERMKYTKYFTGIRNDSGAFESVSGFLVTADDPPMLVAKRMDAENLVEVPRGTVELKDFTKGSHQYYREAAALREAQEELGVTLEVDLHKMCALASKRTQHVDEPHLSDDALVVLADFVDKFLSKLPETVEEHASALLALNRLVGPEGQFPNLVDHASKWFDAKDWSGYLIPIPPWKEFCQVPSVAAQVSRNTLVCVPLDGRHDFHIGAGLPSGNTLRQDAWHALAVPAHVQRSIQKLVHVEHVP